MINNQMTLELNISFGNCLTLFSEWDCVVCLAKISGKFRGRKTSTLFEHLCYICKCIMIGYVGHLDDTVVDQSEKPL